MPLLIEQTPEAIKLAFEVNTNAEIRSVRVSASTWTSLAPDSHPNLPIRLAINRKARILTAPDNILRVEIGFKTDGTLDSPRPQKAKSAKKPGKIFSIECTYEFDYSLNEGFEISQSQAQAFKDGNAIFNAWPFYREFTLNAAQQMGYPALTLPFLRIQPKSPSAGSPIKRPRG